MTILRSRKSLRDEASTLVPTAIFDMGLSTTAIGLYVRLAHAPASPEQILSQCPITRPELDGLVAKLERADLIAIEGHAP